MNFYKMKRLFIPIVVVLLSVSCASVEQPNDENQENTELTAAVAYNSQSDEAALNEKNQVPMEYVEMVTSKGSITMELDPNAAPVTVANFLSYVDDGYYDGTVFHRVIGTFMIQGGGFTQDGQRKSTKDPIVLESDNGLPNDIGTIAMARTNAPNSATSQFFINVVKNDFLNYSPRNPGYAVFGKVIEGMDVVNDIRQVPTGTNNGMGDWPKEDVVIVSIKRTK